LIYNNNMRIDGREIAEEIKSGLKIRIGELAARGIIPKIAIVTLGDEASWSSYVEQKQKVAKELGIDAEVLNLKEANENELLNIVSQIDENPDYHGIIVQRPMPSYISRDKVIETISPKKDVDGFGNNSKFSVPVWLAVKDILERNITGEWGSLRFVVLGRGETAGGPIAAGLTNLGVIPEVIHSQTENPQDLSKSADVIISCVGKPKIITREKIRQGVILIGVGTHDENGKMKGDYEESEVENIAAAYTPTPGGVGPVNLSYLFTNLITAAEDSILAE